MVLWFFAEKGGHGGEGIPNHLRNVGFSFCGEVGLHVSNDLLISAHLEHAEE